MVHRDVPYVTNGHERQKLDLYLPKEGKKLPLVIWVHGGAFRMGSKNDGVPLDYLAEGYVVASINYRLSQHAIFPAQIKTARRPFDGCALTRKSTTWTPNVSGPGERPRADTWSRCSGRRATRRSSTFGENLGVSSRVQAVVDYFGPTDFLQMDDHRLPKGQVHNAPDSPESQLIGGLLAENKEKVARANPITYITKDAPPFLIVHGDLDPLVPHHQSELLAAALGKAGVPVTFYTVKSAGHGGFKDPAVAEMTRRFFEKWLKK